MAAVGANDDGEGNAKAAKKAMEAIKILLGHSDAVSSELAVVEVWDNQMRRIQLASLFQGFKSCACHGEDFPWLAGTKGSHTAVLCGRNAVQLTFPDRSPLSLEALSEKLQSVGTVTLNRFLLRLEVDKYVLTVFRDGRTIVGGTDDIAEARTIHARYIGA